jgi:hypothetical protein
MNSRRLIYIIAAMVVLLAAALLVMASCNVFGVKEVPGRALTDLNLRAGPGVNYPVVGSLSKDTEVIVIGRTEDGSWLKIKTDDGEAWVSGDTDFIEIDRAQLAKAPVVEAPPLAIDASNPKVDQVLNQIPLVVHHEGRQTCASHAGLNNLLPEVTNGNIIGPHSGDFVYDGDNVLFEYSNGGFQLIKENPIARFEGDAKYLSFTEAMQLFARGEIVWTGSIGDWPGRGVAGCDLSASQ